MQTSMQSQDKLTFMNSAQSMNSPQPMSHALPMTSMYPTQPIAPAQAITPALSSHAAPKPQVNSTSSFTSGMWNDSISNVFPQGNMSGPVSHGNYQYDSAVSTGSCFGELGINSSTAHTTNVDSGSRSLMSASENNNKPSGNLSRSDSDEFGDFTSTSESFSQMQSNHGASNHLSNVFQSSTLMNNSSTSQSPSFDLLNIAQSSVAQDNTHLKLGGLTSTSHNSALNVTSTKGPELDNSLFSMLPASAPAERKDLSSAVMASNSEWSPVTQNHTSSHQDNSLVPYAGESKEDVMDEFDDFQTADPVITSTVSGSMESSSSNKTELSHQGYVPGSFTNENADVVYSVAIFSNPIKVDSTPKSDISEFDKLINKSLTGKPTKSSVKSLFKPAQKPSIPSIKSSVTPSEKAADWGSLNLGDVFQIPAEEDDEFGEFSSKSPEAKKHNDISSVLHSSTFDTKRTSSKPQESSSDDLFSLFSASKQSNSYDKVPYISEGTLDSSDTKIGITDLLGITKITETKPMKQSNPITDLFGDDFTSGSECKKPVIESSGIDWTGFTSSQSSILPNVPEPEPVALNETRSSSNLNMDKIPSLYKDIIEYCNTPSGIIDVGKVYEVLLTDKFKVVALQPLMSQCKMMGSPTAKDLVDLIGIVGLKQKGFPAPSKYELNYQKLSLPSVNVSVLKKNKFNQKADKNDQPTLLSFVNQDTKKSKPTFAPVFDFGTSSTKDLSCAPFAEDAKNVSDVSANNDGDDWGDFGSFTEPVEQTNCAWDSNQLSNKNLSSQNNAVLDLFQESSEIHVPPPSQAVSIPKSQTKIPLVLDEPPPLSDDDDEDWADFAHPAHKWDIDPDKIEEQAVNNAASKNRWGTVSISSEKEGKEDNCLDKDFSHIAVEVELNDSQSPNFFAADFSLSSTTKIEEEKSSDPTLFDGPFSSVPTGISADSNVNKDASVADKSDLVAEEGVSKMRKDIDKLASPENQIGDFVSPFADFADEGKQVFDNFFGDSLESVPPENKTTSENFASNFDSPFADFIEESSKADAESTDFADFTASSDLPVTKNVEAENLDHTDFADFESGDAVAPPEEEDEFSDFCGTGDNTDMAKDAVSESLKLTNLPKKDLDGFWNDMVDTLGSNDKSVPVFDLEDEPTILSNEQAVVSSVIPSTVHQPVSYDALKGESFDNEEDRIGAWSKCLSMILTILIQCQNLFGTSNEPSIKQEVVDSEKGKVYLDCCTEVFRVACRISISGASDDGIVEIFKEIKHTWTLISEMLDDSIDLPNIRDFNIRSGKSEDEFCERNCGICVLDTGVENKTSKLKYNGVFYHVTCANFWVNAVNPLLPNLNCQLEDSLL